MNHIPDSELIINPDGSIYHLNLLPEQIAQTIITVGDPERVKRVSQCFDKIEVQVSKREFITHTGQLGRHRISVISTGIGPDNIDITLNELDALANIDFATRQKKAQKTSLKIIRFGTSGGLQADLPIDSILLSSHSIGLDNLLHFYERKNIEEEKALLKLMTENGIKLSVTPYFSKGNKYLLDTLGKGFHQGITLTSPGFYAPQGRSLRLKSLMTPETLDKLAGLSFQQAKISNFEMETAAIYGLSELMGHEALSCSALIANRANKTFSQNPKKAVDDLIEVMLERIEVMLDAELLKKRH
ncbi:MAG: phosphorylase [Saprospiraceae bacterium]|nr:MAG: phosphorylase [Saprospiraceae bacterium]